MAPVTVKRKNIQFALAKVYEGQPITKTLYAEPKLDGLRGAIIIERGNICGALTRTGLPIPNARLIVAELVASGRFDNFVLDGEFMGKDWNESQSIVKTQDAHPDIDNLKFHAFDLVTLKDWNAKKSTIPQETRKNMLKYFLTTVRVPHVVYVEHKLVSSADDIQKEFKRQLKAGYEGIMLKDPDAPYAFKKSKFWLKYKPFFEADLVVTGAVEGRGKHVGRLGALEVQGIARFNGKDVRVESEVGTGFDDATREQLWKEHLKFDYKTAESGLYGRVVEVEFQEVTEDGALRFPSFRRMRDDKVAA